MKIQNFLYKSHYVAGGHRTKNPVAVTYRSVVSRDYVKIALLLAGLHNLDIVSGDIQNVRLTAPNKEKVYCIAGSEFGSDQGKVMIITRVEFSITSSIGSI